MKKKHVVLAAATLYLALTMGAYKSYADAATKKNAKAATESTLTNTEGATQIAASGDSIVVTGDGAVAENGKVTIRKAGTYLLSGTLEEGQLLVDAEEGAEIILVFDGFKISNSTDAPLLFESGSSITLVLKDGGENAVTDLRSSAEENKAGIYTKSDLTISGNGTLDVTGTAEDAIHSKTNVTVQGGTINLKAGDDAIHADETLTILDGKVTVLESEEGLEGLVVDIQGGDITVNASDDGLNASDGSGSDKAPGQATEGAEIRISGGVLTVKAGGDGIDSNGDLIISGGTVVVDGPSDGGNAPIDYDGKGVISGGTVFVSGDSGMFQSLNDSGSTQNSIVYYLSETQAAGTKVAVADSKGNVIYENNSTTQAFNTVLFSAADLKSGENYIVTVGEQSETVSISDTVNNIGENRDGNGPQGGMNGVTGVTDDKDTIARVRVTKTERTAVLSAEIVRSARVRAEKTERTAVLSAEIVRSARVRVTKTERTAVLSTAIARSARVRTEKTERTATLNAASVRSARVRAEKTERTAALSAASVRSGIVKHRRREIEMRRWRLRRSTRMRAYSFRKMGR